MSVLFLGAGIFGMQSCQANRNSGINSSSSIKKTIAQLELRIKQLEKKIEHKSTSNTSRDIKAPSGPVKSLTFRLGTKDDRLRIYWADGRYSDLPCTKEQSIWACG